MVVYAPAHRQREVLCEIVIDLSKQARNVIAEIKVRIGLRAVAIALISQTQNPVPIALLTREGCFQQVILVFVCLCDVPIDMVMVLNHCGRSDLARNVGTKLGLRNNAAINTRGILG